MFSTLILALALQASPAVREFPNGEEIRQALAQQLAASCGDDRACIARQPVVEVLNVACANVSLFAVACRYDVRIGTADFRADQNRFGWDADNRVWVVGEVYQR